MTDEQPVVLKKRKNVATDQVEGYVCIVHYENRVQPEEVVKPLTSVGFSTILNAISVRKSQESACNRLDQICSSVPPIYDGTIHGYHRWCYQSFTNVSKLKRKITDKDNTLHEQLVSGSKQLLSKIVCPLRPALLHEAKLQIHRRVCSFLKMLHLL